MLILELLGEPVTAFLSVAVLVLTWLPWPDRPDRLPCVGAWEGGGKEGGKKGGREEGRREGGRWEGGREEGGREDCFRGQLKTLVREEGKSGDEVNAQGRSWSLKPKPFAG